MHAAIVGVPFDPLRSRMRFLEVLPPAGRRVLVGSTLAKARQHLAVIDADCDAKRAGDNRAKYHVARGAQLMMQTRVAWLEELEADLPGISAPRTTPEAPRRATAEEKPEGADDAHLASVRGEDPNSGSARPAKHRDDSR